MKHALIPASWDVWGSFPNSSDKDLHTYNVIWRAFSPDKMYIVEVKWRPEQDPKGSMVCCLIAEQDYKNRLYETRPRTVKELITEVQNIVSKLPDIYGKIKNGVYQEGGEELEEQQEKRTSLLEASSVVKPKEKQKKRKYTKRAKHAV